MSKELITDMGRIFKRTQNGYVERTPEGYRGKPLNERELKRELVKNSEKAHDMGDMAKSRPQFTQLMWDKANHKV